MQSFLQPPVFKKEKDGSLLITMEVGGLVEVMIWVMGMSIPGEERKLLTSW